MVAIQPAMIGVTAFRRVSNLYHDLELAVATVAHDIMPSMLAAAKIYGAGFFCLIFFGAKFRALVRAITERLGFALATRAPPVAFASFDFGSKRGFLCNNGCSHDVLHDN